MDLTKSKELQEKECEKLSNELQQHIQDRKDLEQLAKRLNKTQNKFKGRDNCCKMSTYKIKISFRITTKN